MPEATSGREFGRAHGESFRGEIQSLAALRVYLCRTVGGFGSDAEVRSLAVEHLPVLRAFSEALADELEGIAEGAKVSPEDIMILNHYTDLRDLGRSRNMDEDGCSVLYARTDEGPVLAQTWDMHATAIPYVMMLHVPSALGGEAWVLSLTGCLGMAGLGPQGVGVAINNLPSTDAKVGVAWSALVRRMLTEKSAKDAKGVLLSAPIGSGHHYFVADETDAFGVETSGQLLENVFAGGTQFVHTNHCLHANVATKTAVPPRSTTMDRYQKLSRDILQRPVTSARDAYDRLGSQDGYPRSVCTNTSTPETPHGPATCGAISMDLAKRELLAVAGFPHNVEPRRYSL